MKTYILCTIFLCCLSSNLKAQEIDSLDYYSFDEILVTVFSQLLERDDDVTVQGSEYLFDQWSKATMVVKLGTHSQEISFDLVRYNVERDFVEVVHEGRPLVTEGKLLKVIELTDPQTGKVRRLVPIEGMAKYSNEGYTGLCELLADGPVKLIRHFRKELYEANYDVALDVGEKRDRLVHIENTFLVRGGLFLKVNGKKDVLDTLHDADVKTLIKEEKLNLKEDEDLIRVVSYYNDKVSQKSE